MDAVGPDGSGQVGPVVEDEGHPVGPADPLHQRGPLGSARRSSRCFSRSWTRSTPPSDAGFDEPLEVRSVGSAEIEPPVVEAPGVRRGHGWSQPDVGPPWPWPWPWPSPWPSACTGAPWPGPRASRCPPPTGRYRLSPNGEAAFSQPGGRIPSCLPSRATKIRAFCSPNPGSAFTLARSCLAVGGRCPDGCGIAPVGVDDDRAHLLDPSGHRPGEPVERRPLAEHRGQGLGVHGGQLRPRPARRPAVPAGRRATGRPAPGGPAGPAPWR